MTKVRIATLYSGQLKLSCVEALGSCHGQSNIWNHIKPFKLYIFYSFALALNVRPLMLIVQMCWQMPEKICWW